MTAPTASRFCGHCHQRVMGRQLATLVPGAVPVVMSLCRCDYLTCSSCNTTVYDRSARKCASCGQDPGVRRA